MLNEPMTRKKYSKLFEPVRISQVEIKNRIAMAPMGIFGLTTLLGAFSQRAIDYYVERARGGTGLIITAPVKVENEIEKRPMPSQACVSINPTRFIQLASELTEKVHAYGTRIFMQLTGGFGRLSVPSNLLSPPVSSSEIPNYWEPEVMCRALTVDEIERLVEAFGEAARIAVAAGFDGVEIHGMNAGHLLDQFAITMFNKRTDKYGGDLKNRLRLPVEIVKQIKSSVGIDFPVQLRYSLKSFIKDWRQGGLPGEDFREAGRDIQEALEAARILEAAGYDAFNADVGSYDARYWAHPPLYQNHGCYLPFTRKLKEVAKVPVIVAGRMELPDLAESALIRGEADIIALGRGLLADPGWPSKVLEGSTDIIRPCLGCHDGCFERAYLRRTLSCAVNPSCGREKDYGIQPASKAKNVTVVGGGIAGMEASRVASIRGHKVTLYEKGHRLGGHLIEGSIPSFKLDVVRLLHWYETELAHLGVKIHLNQEATLELIQKENPEALLISTGWNWAIPDIPGIDKGIVTTMTDMLLGRKKIEEPAIILGGDLLSCETAFWLAQEGRKVTLVVKEDEPVKSGIPVCPANRNMLIDLLKFHQVKVLVNTSPVGITDAGVRIIDKDLRRTVIPAGTVVISIGSRPEQSLLRNLGSNLPNMFVIGNEKKSRNIMNAIWDAYEVARNI